MLWIRFRCATEIPFQRSRLAQDGGPALFAGLLRSFKLRRSIIVLFPLILVFGLWPIDLLQARPAFEQTVDSLSSPLEQGSFVYDGAGILGKRKEDIDALCKAMYEAGGAQIAVVTLQSLGDANIEEFAAYLFQHWGIGEKEKDNGILLLHATGPRKVRLEVGYGLEGVLPDVKADWIIEDVGIPLFKEGKFADGHYYMVQSLLRILLNPSAGRAEIVERKNTIEPGNKISSDRIPDALYLSSQEERKERRQEKEAENAGPGWISISFLATGFFLGSWLLIRSVRRYRRLIASDQEEKKKYDVFDDAILEHSGIAVFLFIGIIAAEVGFASTFWSTIALPLAVVAAWLLHDRYLKRFRNAPRICSQCGRKMERLSEESDDAYLAAGQIEEEKAGSVDYDVWVCECGHAKIERYRSPGSDNACPSCQYLTFQLAETRTVEKPSYEAPGQGQKIYRCSHCEYEKTESFEIARLKHEHETAGGMARTLAGAALVAAMSDAAHSSSISAGFSSAASSGSESDYDGAAAFEIPDDFGGGESGGGGASGEY